jgi:Peptidase family C25
MSSLLILIFLAVVAPPATPDTLVVCPMEFRSALAEWEAFRQAQGHAIRVISPPSSAEHLRTTIRNVGRSGQLKYLVLIGDVPSVRAPAAGTSKTTIPTNYLPAKVNVRFGSDPMIASDIPYADIDGDDIPDLAIGRIPADSLAELATVLRKSLRYEQQAKNGAWERRLNIASGNGGFGTVTDAIIETAARQIITQNVPAEYQTHHICPSATSDKGQVLASFAVRAREQLSEGSLAWVYLGHGLPTELDRVPTATGSESILSVDDVPKLRCSGHSPLVVLVACYTGAMDAPRDCLAEELLMAEEGPMAVIAATRITMPYGNTVLGCELLRSCFRDRPEHLGDTLRIAAQKTLATSTDNPLRASLDAMATGISPSPVDLESERREHVLMYHMFGDPLLHLRYTSSSQPPAKQAARRADKSYAK